MGIDRFQYLGPYAEFTLPLVSEKADNCRRPDACPNAPQNTTGFCRTCGIELKKRFREVLRTEPSFDLVLFEMIKEALFRADGVHGPEMPSKDKVIYRLVPNVTREGQPREFHLDTEGALCINAVDLDPHTESEWFQRAFAAEWETLANVFGPFTFNWGYLQWFN